MSQEVISIIVPTRVSVPRGAVAAAWIAGWLQQGARHLARAGAAIWRALQAEGERRALRELRMRGPATAAVEAARVREMADRYERTDRRFAAELRAAAARHETLHGIS